MAVISIEAFQAVDIRLGTIVLAETFPEARKPAYKLKIDFGNEIGLRRSSAQITHLYKVEELVGRQVFGVVNLAPRQIGSFLSEVLVLGVTNEEGQVILANVDRSAANGSRMY
jgi:tRNA-binding protein